ncbi:Mg2+ transporter zinc transport protein [Penicillium angulare]|uniref:Mg2+ transporter zinc transport protein n=1 Tax=Penicillium angulare TaxID=116970 RepID=UPI002541B433|nr:Mg2+ transporter zinc transport protein [Penicillium angulare]KAJ5291325.1 Mg2+ transporter zinc transport protein [Penicillium angulare]
MDTLEQSDLKNISPKSYFDSHETWSSMNEAMETLKEDLGQIEKHIQDWRTREDRLANERPRWTRNDEYRYRDAINRVQLLHDIVERNFKATEADVRKVAQILKLRQETQKAKYDQTMTDLSWRQNANVALFTYATVFFLPLGFATSFLSMQAPPSSYLIRQMVFCFLGALGVLIGVVAVVLILISQHTDSDLSISRGAPKTYRNVSGAVKKWISRHKNSSNDTEAQTV